MKLVFGNKRGSSHIAGVIIVIMFSLITSVLMYMAYVQIQTSVIRNAMKTGLANLAYTISDDTYAALRESSFEEYILKLTGSEDYRRKLEKAYREDVEKSLDLRTGRYRVDSVSLDFVCEDRRIRYICTCDIAFYINMFGQNLTAEVKSVQVEGSHMAKY